MSKTIHAIATKIDSKHFYFECPVCVEKYTNKGVPNKRSRRVIHYHGSNGDLSNRVEKNLSHHQNHIYGRAWGNVVVSITDATQRV